MTPAQLADARRRRRRQQQRARRHPDGCAICRPRDPCSRPVPPDAPTPKETPR